MADADTRRPARPRVPRTLKARAIGYLARREYARGELRDKLLAGADAPAREAVDAVLDELAALGYLSDARYANAVVRQKRGGYSRRAIAEALKARGVAGEVTADALAERDLDDASALAALWRRRFGQAPAGEREKARQIRFLASRGFALSAILRLLRHPPADDSGDDPPTR
jgi:regulatory protein